MNKNAHLAIESNGQPDNTEATRRTTVDTTKEKKHGSFLLAALITIVVAAIAGGTGYVIYERTRNDGSTNRIDEGAIANAERSLENLFKSAQQTFIHRNQTRMAASIEELGENFSVGSNGTIIYREIWYARYGRPESDIPEPSKQEDWERKALADPYRYAVLPVKDLESPGLDDRTSVLVAIPVSETSVPGLVMVAGPVRNDPADFLREWPIRRITTAEGCRMIRKRVEAGQPYDKAFADALSPHFEEL